MNRGPFFKTLSVIVISLSLIIGSCAIKTQTKTIKPLTDFDRSKLRKMAIVVRLDDELNVNISGLKNRFWVELIQGSGSCNSIGCIFLPAVWVVAIVVEESIRSTLDHTKENDFREDITDVNLEQLIADNIDKYFETTNSSIEAEVSQIQDPILLAQNGYDSILDITLEKFELNLCPKQVVYGHIDSKEARQGVGPLTIDDREMSDAIMRWNSIKPLHFQIKQPSAESAFLYGVDNIKQPKEDKEELDRLQKEIAMIKPQIEEYSSGSSGDQVRIWITFDGKIISTKNNKTIWEKEEVFYDPKCEKVKNIQNNPELIIDMITRSTNELAINTVNEVLLSKNAE